MINNELLMHATRVEFPVICLHYDITPCAAGGGRGRGAAAAAGGGAVRGAYVRGLKLKKRR